MSEINVKLGELIRLERERQNINLEDFSTQLKISSANLESIESGDSSKLPSDLYFNLFAKSCCEALGIDFIRTVDAIKMEFSETAPPNENSDNSKSKENSKNLSDNSGKDEKLQLKKLAYMLGGIIGIFVIFMLIYFIFFNSDTPNSQSSNIPDNIENAQANNNNNDVGIAATYDWNTSEYTPPEPIELKLTASKESWATVLADGDTSLFRSLIPNKQYIINADYRIQISVGIPRFVEIELNGTKINLVNPETRRISKVKINQINLKSFLEFKIEKKIETNRINKPPENNTDTTDTTNSINIPSENSIDTSIDTTAQPTQTENTNEKEEGN
ncbi:MAG: DUF4115 domain-containing protein [candidate division Zixibacteria bacterium]|nr:DUF4115 domain-containing protein [candidate division Zixibacteria bacterium]